MFLFFNITHFIVRTNMWHDLCKNLTNSRNDKSQVKIFILSYIFLGNISLKYLNRSTNSCKFVQEGPVFPLVLIIKTNLHHIFLNWQGKLTTTILIFSISVLLHRDISKNVFSRNLWEIVNMKSEGNFLTLAIW